MSVLTAFVAIKAFTARTDNESRRLSHTGDAVQDPDTFDPTVPCRHVGDDVATLGAGNEAYFDLSLDTPITRNVLRVDHH